MRLFVKAKSDVPYDGMKRQDDTFFVKESEFSSSCMVKVSDEEAELILSKQEFLDYKKERTPKKSKKKSSLKDDDLKQESLI